MSPLGKPDGPNLGLGPPGVRPLGGGGDRPLFGVFTGLTPFPKAASRLDHFVVAHVCPLFGMETGLTPFPKRLSSRAQFVEAWVAPLARAGGGGR